MLRKSIKVSRKELINIKLSLSTALYKYLLVEEGILTNEEAELFGYQELNTYGAYYSVKKEDIKEIFKLAKEIHPDNPKKGLKELSEVSYQKIDYLFNFKPKIIKNQISFVEVTTYSLADLNLLKKNLTLLKEIRPKEIIDLFRAVTEDNVLTHKILLEIANRISKVNILLEWAALKGHLDIVNTLLDKAGKDITNDNKGKALILFCRK